MATKKYYSINFPFTADAPENFYVDLASDPYVGIKQDLMHLLFTPKGQRLRNPDFGTNLMRQIFEPNDDVTFGDIKIEMQTVISKYFPNVSITTLDVIPDAENRSVTINLAYDINQGNFTVQDQINYSL